MRGLDAGAAIAVNSGPGHALLRTMRPGITSKLFLALLAVSIVTVLAMSIASRVSFTRGFLGYLNEQGIERVESLLPVFAAAYERHGGWDFLRGRRRPWFELLRSGTAGSPPGEGAPASTYPRPDTALRGTDLRIGLLDASGRYVAGNPEIGPDAARRAVRVDGRVVGWLAVLPFQRASGAADLRFQERQQRTTWLIAAASVLLAAAVAVWLARRMLGGLRQVTGSVHRLAAGDYTVRVPALSRDEIGLLAEDCNRLAETLQRTEQMRRTFMADISHELRTPLAVLRAELEAIEDNVRQPTMESIRSLQGEVATLCKLVDDLYALSLSDVGALAYRMDEVDVGAILSLALEAFHERLEEKRIRVQTRGLESGLRVRGDADRLRQLFGNLIENSLRYTDAGGTLCVACRNEGERIAVDLQDSAPGVPTELLPRLFERFYRVEASRSRASGGAGLGLAICKSIVEAHGGRITARLSALGGLWIELALPSARA